MPTFHARIVELYAHLQNLSVAKYGRKDFAKFLGVSVGKVNGWLDGTGRPNFEMLKEISAHSGVSILWLIGASNEMYMISEDKLPMETGLKRDYELLWQFLKFKHSYEQGLKEENPIEPENE